MKKKKFSLTTTQIILLNFFAVILIGGLLLMLPISSATRKPAAVIDAFFTATTATCVTGLVTVPTATSWSVFGQAVILILIQIGGIGIITLVMGTMLLFNRKIGLSDRMLIQDSFNLNTLSGLVMFVKKVIIGTVAAEALGALFYMTVFIPEFGKKGIWISVFNSVSAFCNAGMDIIGENSLSDYAANPIINITTSFLIIIGGLGYFVWWDVLRVIKMKTIKKCRFFRSLTFHSKIVLVTTLTLLLGGAVLIFAFEYSNPLTLGKKPLSDKLQIAFFQSVTTRTAGFASISQKELTNGASIVSLLLMFIGGSPIGTAGGVKTVTVAVLFFTAVSMIRNKASVSLFNRSFSRQSINKAIAVIFSSFSIILVSSLLLSTTNKASFLDIIFETVSAISTVGLSRDLTPTLNIFGKIIIIFTMYFGRVGPISLALALSGKRTGQNIIKDPTEEISVG